MMRKDKILPSVYAFTDKQMAFTQILIGWRLYQRHHKCYKDFSCIARTLAPFLHGFVGSAVTLTFPYETSGSFRHF